MVYMSIHRRTQGGGARGVCIPLFFAPLFIFCTPHFLFCCPLLITICALMNSYFTMNYHQLAARDNVW